MERGELIVTTEAPEAVRRVKIGSLAGTVILAALLIWMGLKSETSSVQSNLFTFIMGGALVVIGIVNFRAPESYCAAYENGVVGRAVASGAFSVNTTPFELTYDEIRELRQYKKRGMENHLLICSDKGDFQIYCRENRNALIRVLVQKIAPETAEETEE